MNAPLSDPPETTDAETGNIEEAEYTGGYEGGYYGSSYAEHDPTEYEIDEDALDFSDYEYDDYEGHYYDYDEEAERYAQQLKEFMDDFEPSD